MKSFLAIIVFVALCLQTAQAFPIHFNNKQQTTKHQQQKTMCFSSKGDDSSEEKDFEVQTWNPLRLAVLKLGMTEPAWTSSFNYQKKKGVFSCAYCGNELFDSESKYDSGSGWPSFWRSKQEGAIGYKMEFGNRLECRCNKCGGHLGHVFLDGPKQTDVPSSLLQTSPASDPRSQRENGRLPRFCVNGASLRLKEEVQEQ
ncbi:unnamed protein product [Cylindrotheca closterium]|uniref:peptide-methionine (R)-S-oxide reductase n=1 Tax=Cylindrotheca closterium TaxID=2856 RepID=A0AAD2FWB5_9STRA|nr:unnamed protein product [Cylindrotheca closterium]